MNGRLIFAHYRDGILSALLADGKAVELSFYPEVSSTDHTADPETAAGVSSEAGFTAESVPLQETKQSRSVLGNIYVGRVLSVSKNINAAFIEIENGLHCYYSLESEKYPFYTTAGKNGKPKQGDELIVQVSREAIKTKAPTVTSAISLTGRYLVCNYGKQGIGCSGKLNAVQKEQLSEILQNVLSEQYGWIIRTNASQASKEELIAEAQLLSGQMDSIFARARFLRAGSCLYRSESPFISRLKNLYGTEYSCVTTDDPQIFSEITDYLCSIPSGTGLNPETYKVRRIGSDGISTYTDFQNLRVELYADPLQSLCKRYSLETAVENALHERVWLKSGGYLVIQPTEALTVIDVNTGKCVEGKNRQKTFRKINLEAAQEAAVQLRLRNISGIVIIDFINMESAEDRKEVLTVLSDALRKDPQKAVLVDLTELGLVEITRKRKGRPFAEQLRNNHDLQLT